MPTSKVKDVIFSELSSNEKNVLLLVIYKFLTAAYTSHEFIKTEVILGIDGEEFKATGKQVTIQGFKEFENHLNELLKKPEKENQESLIPELQEGQVIPKVPIKSIEKKTTPPKPYTESSLLGAMENVMSSLEDEQLKVEVKDKALGTVATRANIIERIIKTGFIERKGKSLIATQKAYNLIDILPDKIKSPILTAEWEQQLEAINAGNYNNTEFMNNIETFVTSLINEFKDSKPNEALLNSIASSNEKEVIGQCPRCGKDVYEGNKNFYCSGYKAEPKCTFSLWKEDKFFGTRGKKITKSMAKSILKNGYVDIKNLKSKNDKSYNARFIMNDSNNYVNFKMEFIK